MQRSSDTGECFSGHEDLARGAEGDSGIVGIGEYGGQFDGGFDLCQGTLRQDPLKVGKVGVTWWPGSR